MTQLYEDEDDDNKVNDLKKNLQECLEKLKRRKLSIPNEKNIKPEKVENENEQAQKLLNWLIG